MTFCLTGIWSATRFLTQWPGTHLRRVDISVQLDYTLQDLHQPPDNQAIVTQSDIEEDRTPWEQMCVALSQLSSLRELRLWVETADLMPRHEIRLLTPLLDIGFLAKDKFVVCLPWPAPPFTTSRAALLKPKALS